MRTVAMLLCCLLPVLGSASTLKGKFEGGQIVWNNVMELQSDYFSPTWWSPSHKLPPVQSWVAGGFHSAPPSTVSLSNGVDQVTANITLVGVQYQITESGLSENPESGQACAFRHRSGAVLSLVGAAGCQYDQRFQYTAAITPYSFTRPIFQIDQQALYTQLVRSSPGVYRGVMTMSTFYDYFSPGGARARYVDNQQVFVEIDNQPSYITRVVVGPSDEQAFVMRYDRLNNELSGQARFQVSVEGYFAQGLTVSLDSGRSQYLMRESGGAEFPYTILCHGCRDSRLVEQGMPSLTSTVVPGNATTQLALELEVFFEQIALDGLVDGLYSDAFSLYFEPTL